MKKYEPRWWGWRWLLFYAFLFFTGLALSYWNEVMASSEPSPPRALTLCPVDVTSEQTIYSQCKDYLGLRGKQLTRQDRRAIRQCRALCE